ncbi:hypothetical protein BD324DRAFT_578686 [Kockovaella imperatae]|uniref:G-patch domain-containing protein n=1 Tax=Kockovaella imperatae TaxID=4999 RepID=A0A1Y1UIT3_9TREE|nr:hypothetical protein BD324DRAFT_578686 [Kockovaella imperatae]ORX37960.1 hypothetical protein BD324DRAFT_578686 [Kockovaella imperatae]
MTSRLKHKLELENINLKSAYLNESFVYIGTPLPALAETRKDKLEYVPEWQQEARDEKGRRRFHGAFTGGWSAGYGNTVGSKEGWAPSTFKSSRNNRASASQRPEDFMDEEDLQQMNDDRKLENTDTFKNDGFAGTREELANKGLPSSLESLIAPATTSIGQKLLTKLGWRPGQGIGPRISLRKRRIQEGKLGRLGTEVPEDDLDDAEAGKHTFAPRDVKLLVFDPKDDRQGLGYQRGSGLGRLAGTAAFGAARRPEMDEDEDPYAETSTSNQRFVLDQGGDDEGDIIMVGGHADRTKNSRDTTSGPDRTDRWHDGRPILPGFTLDPKGVPPDKWFEMPDIPPDWRPRPARVWGTTRKWDETSATVKEEKEVIRGAPGKPLSFEERGAALGEEQRISKAKSVFEYMSEKDRERLASIAAAAKTSAPLPLAMDQPEAEEVEARPPAEDVVIPPLSPRTASAALKGFIPYGDDPSKQDRYRSYLQSQTLHTTQPDPVLRSGTFDEINKELEDFASSARIFKPMSFAMSSRFTSGSASLAATDLKQAKPGLHLYDAEKAKAEAAKPKVVEVEVKKALTPREQAAANGMYGQMTRVIKEFYPVKLLCKRFGVADPHPEGDPGKGEGGNDNSVDNTFEHAPLPTNDASWEDKFIHQEASASEPSNANLATEERKPRTIGEVGMADDANQGRDTLSYIKPSIDIFKAIFASDDEDEEEAEEAPSTKQAIQAVNGVGAGDDKLARRADPFPVKEEGPVDLAVFKPVFKIRKDEPESAAAKEEKKKAKKDKKKRKGVLSFDVGEDGDDDEPAKKKVDKKRLKTGEGEKEEGGGDEGVWVEKPEIKPRLVGRKGAADYM